MEPVTVYLGLGTNLGNREANLERALKLLAERLRMGKVSSSYDTEPWGVPDQPHFLNLVCQVFTTVSPGGLLSFIKGIEMRMGRTGNSSQPRPIDIDILFYGEQVVETGELTIPHPRLTERAFVLVPLTEIAPDLVHSGNGRIVSELLAVVEGKAGVLKWGAEK